MADSTITDALTTGKIEGSGAFDALMKSVKSHLQVEFDAGRIRGTDYSNAYVQAIEATLAHASQIAISQSRLASEIALSEAQRLRIEQETSNLVTQNQLIKSQTKEVETATEIKQYQLDCILPKEANNLLLAGILTGAQTSAAVQQTNNMMEQHKGIVIENKTKEYQFKELLPLEKIKLETANRMVDAQISGIMTDNDMKTFQMDFMLPKELEIKEAQLAIADKDLLIKAEQLLISKYELQNKLPADVALVKAQDALYTQKTVTETAQVDSTVVGVDSVIDLSNKLLKEQAEAYVVNGNQTAAKLMIDTWNVRHTNDPEGNLENDANKLTDANIGVAVAKIL